MITPLLQYLPKETNRYSTINWFSWQAWLWPRKLPLADTVTFDESNLETRQQQQQQGSRQYVVGTNMSTSVFVTPAASPPCKPSL